MSQSGIFLVNDENFQQIISQGNCLVDFYSDSCGPCKMMNPIIDELAQELEGKLKVCKVNVEHAPKVVGLFSITHVPTLIFLKDGQEQERTVGLKDKDELLELVGC